MTENQIKHLEFIQGIITRMSQNSFQLKEWMIAIISALLALYANSNNVVYIFVALVPVLLFWFLDAYYLQQERKFRGIYNDIASSPNDNKIKAFTMPINRYSNGEYYYWNVLKSKTLLGLYLTMFVILLLGGLVLTLKDCFHFCNYGY